MGFIVPCLSHLAEITIPFLLAWSPPGVAMVRRSHSFPARVSQRRLLRMALQTPSGDASNLLRYCCRSEYLSSKGRAEREDGLPAWFGYAMRRWRYLVLAGRCVVSEASWGGHNPSHNGVTRWARFGSENIHWCVWWILLQFLPGAFVRECAPFFQAQAVLAASSNLYRDTQFLPRSTAAEDQHLAVFRDIAMR